MATYEKMVCVDCKHYEQFHKYPNPNAVARHYCKKCNDEIRYVRASALSDMYLVYVPKGCYFNDYFEESEEAKERRDRYNKCRAGFGFYQIED